LKGEADAKQWVEQLEQLKRENSELVAAMEELDSQQQVAMGKFSVASLSFGDFRRRLPNALKHSK